MPNDQAQSRQTGDALVAALHHIELGCSDLTKVGAFYEQALGYGLSQQDGAVIASGPDRHLVLLPGERRKLLSAGYALPDQAALARLRERIQKAGWRSEDAPTRLFQDSVMVRDPDGNLFAFGLPRVQEGRVASKLPPARLQHVVIASRDPRRIVSFFIGVLGFALSDDVVDDEGGLRTSFLRCSHEHHSFAVFQASENRFDHHCYETGSWNDIRDWADHMAAQHIQIQWGPGRHGPGNNLFIFVHDPDGNWVELSAELEIVKPDRAVGKWTHEQRTLNSWGVGKLRS